MENGLREATIAAMSILSIQIQPERLGGIQTDHIVVQLRAAAEAHANVSAVEVARGDNEGPFVNVNITSDDLPALWLVVKQQVEAAQIASGCIVVCQGARCWDDYLLLHHFDPEKKLDSI